VRIFWQISLWNFVNGLLHLVLFTPLPLICFF
jgi:hypothetical protein